MVRSVAWGYVRIMAGTIVGGGLGFYVMHRLEISYKNSTGRNRKQINLNKKKNHYELVSP
uniref:Uncharacterized protein n=1 Tax=Helianthus annuus TaxID=4232 RepID=A0A251URF2_HELAN